MVNNVKQRKQTRQINEIILLTRIYACNSLVLQLYFFTINGFSKHLLQILVSQYI